MPTFVIVLMLHLEPAYFLTISSIFPAIDLRNRQ